jgi:hypothetical protein
LLPTKENGDYAKRALLDLKVAAEQAQAGQRPSFYAKGEIMGFKPYEDLNIENLLKVH